ASASSASYCASYRASDCGRSTAACGLGRTRRRAARGARGELAAPAAPAAPEERLDGCNEGLHGGALYHGKPLAHGPDGGRVIPGAEDGRPGDERVGAGARHLGDVVGLDAAVDLQPDVLAERVDAAARLADLR